MTLTASARRVAGLVVVIAALGAATSPQTLASSSPPVSASPGPPKPSGKGLPKSAPAKPRGGVKGAPGALPPRR
jgi:hypothetical protein